MSEETSGAPVQETVETLAEICEKDYKIVAQIVEKYFKEVEVWAEDEFTAIKAFLAKHL